MNREMIPVILFGDHIAAYGVIRALGPLGIPIYVISNSGAGIATKSRFVRKSLGLEPDRNDFVEKLVSWVRKEAGVTAVLMVAGQDDYLDVLSRNTDQLLPDLKPTFPAWETVRKVRYKHETYSIAERIGIPAPKTFYINTLCQLEECLDNFKHDEFPLLMKSEDSSRFAKQYGTKGVVCNHRDEVLANYNRYDFFLGRLLLQEMIPGGENHLLNLIAVLNAHSDPVAVFMNRKRRSAKRFSNCTLMETMWSDDVLRYSLKLLKEIGYMGYANPEFKLDPRDGRLKLIEINGRISMSNSHALRCGINLPLNMYQEALKGPLHAQEEFRKTYSDNILWWYLSGDTLSSINALRNKEITAAEYIRSIVGKGYIIEPIKITDLRVATFSILHELGYAPLFNRFRFFRKFIE